MAAVLRKDNYDGGISFESVYPAGGGDFENGFRECVDTFKQIFG
jgi:hypothetical protein